MDLHQRTMQVVIFLEIRGTKHIILATYCSHLQNEDC